MNNHTIRAGYQCNLKTLTPVHVGSGEKLVENFDFFRQNNKIYVIKSSKMFAAVEKLGADKIMEFTKAVENGDIVAWFQRLGIHLNKIASYSFNFLEKKTPREIHAHLRDAFGNPLIPGSSLKGALRTAIIRKLAKAEDDFQVKAKGTKPKYMDQAICGALLGRDPKENLLRTLSVGDYTFQSNQTSIQQVWVNRLTSKTNLAGKFPIHIEGISNNTATQGIISFDEFLPDKDSEENCFKFKARLSLPWLTDACRSLTQHTIDTELRFLESKIGKPVEGLRKFYTKISEQIQNLTENEVIIQMAWGSGWRGMTGQLLESDDITDDLRKKLQLADRYLSFPFPKSRRVVNVSGSELPMGWIKLSFRPMEEVKEEEKERRQQQISLQKECKKREEEEVQRKAELEGMTPEEMEIAEISDPSVLESRVVEIFNRIDEFSEENKKTLAVALKKYWEIHAKWKKKDCSKKQWKKVQRFKGILGE